MSRFLTTPTHGARPAGQGKLDSIRQGHLTVLSSWEIGEKRTDQEGVIIGSIPIPKTIAALITIALGFPASRLPRQWVFLVEQILQ